jgi:hypothetical protein
MLRSALDGSERLLFGARFSSNKGGLTTDIR